MNIAIGKTWRAGEATIGSGTSNFISSLSRLATIFWAIAGFAAPRTVRRVKLIVLLPVTILVTFPMIRNSPARRYSLVSGE